MGASRLTKRLIGAGDWELFSQFQHHLLPVVYATVL